MKLSKKSRYGLAALIDLAINSKTGHVALGSIAERNDISPQYLEQVFAGLRRAGIVKSVKGSQGGYLLGQSASKITVAHILEALEGSYKLEPQDTPADSNCRAISDSIQEMVVDRVNQCLDEILTELTLADLVQHYTERENIAQDMYYI